MIAALLPSGSQQKRNTCWCFLFSVIIEFSVEGFRSGVIQTLVFIPNTHTESKAVFSHHLCLQNPKSLVNVQEVDLEVYQPCNTKINILFSTLQVLFPARQ